MPPITEPVKVNVDLGGGCRNFECGPDHELIPIVGHANIACRRHAGDLLIIVRELRACKQHRIAACAHPYLSDIVRDFGRRKMVVDQEEVQATSMCCQDQEACRAAYRVVQKGVKIFGLVGTIDDEFACDKKYNKDRTLQAHTDVEKHITTQLEDWSMIAAIGEWDCNIRGETA
ncbi:hypothetical protein K431DRAFT_340606 [Polychaeton citri CBS 116435]|uniref:Uncharacterized protein n=1 Tax=Polychaeton citri CBS 116435 TaxID=1314669 RepID=A0A9P4UM54_9PEZI|nr:hypothetical protein K431DRAFT_340606 [Polychaeton citri CBS 116435]